MLYDTIKNKIKEKMMQKDQAALMTYRNILSAFTNELVANGRKPTEMLSDEEALVVIKRLAKKGGKAVELFKQGNRQDLVDKEEAEIEILKSYLPKNDEDKKEINHS